MGSRLPLHVWLMILSAWRCLIEELLLSILQWKLPKDANVAAYRRLVGPLLYLTNIRPDICFVVTFLIQYISHPMHSHYQAALWVLRYLKGILGHGIFLPSNYELKLKCLSDLDWASYLDSWHSFTGYYIYLGNSLVS